MSGHAKYMAWLDGVAATKARHIAAMLREGYDLRVVVDARVLAELLNNLAAIAERSADDDF